MKLLGSRSMNKLIACIFCKVQMNSAAPLSAVTVMPNNNSLVMAQPERRHKSHLVLS